MNNQELKPKGQMFTLQNFIDSGEYENLGANASTSFYFIKGEKVTFDEIDRMLIDVRTITLNKKEYNVAYISATSSSPMRGRMWFPISVLRMKPTRNDEEKFYKESPICAEMLDPSRCYNDIDRIKRIAGRTISATPSVGLKKDVWKREGDQNVRHEGEGDFHGWNIVEVLDSSKVSK